MNVSEVRLSAQLCARVWAGLCQFPTQLVNAGKKRGRRESTVHGIAERAFSQESLSNDHGEKSRTSIRINPKAMGNQPTETSHRMSQESRLSHVHSSAASVPSNG